jgi:excisionase family DNA binding protein
MSTGEVAEYLGVNTRTLYRMIDEGELPAYKFGRVIRLQEQDVLGFLERARIAPGSLEHLYPMPSRADA